MPGIDLITPGDMLALDPAASGVAHGYGLFETIRLRGGALELWEPHWARLTRSAQHLGLPCPFDRAEALESVKTLARALPAEAVIKLSLLKEGTSSRLLVYSRPVLEPPESLGLFLDTPGRIDEGSILAGHKTHNYLENLLVLEAAREQDCFDGLRCNSRGDLAEGAISNLFFLSDGRLHTPSRESGLLPGVVRQALIEVAAVTEGRYTRADLLSADAVYLSNASIGLQPVDWLMSETERIELPSRRMAAYARARELLREHIRATAVQVP